MSLTCTLGVDIGGTRLKVGLVRDGEVLRRVVLAMTAKTAAGLTDLIAAAAAELRRDAGAVITAVGVGVPGVLGLGGAPVLSSPNLPWLNGVDFASLLSAALDLPVRCDNDANCVGWGEAMAGAGRGEPHQLCLALGTGVGGSLIIDGQLEHGSRGRGMELGHLCVDPRGPPCGCGGQGCLEQYASQTGLLRQLREVGLRADGPDAIVALFASGRQGDPRAKAVIEWTGDALGQAIAGLHSLTGVSCVLFAGGIAAALPDLEPSIRARLRQLRAPPALRLLRGSLDTDAGVIGAALLGAAPDRRRYLQGMAPNLP